MTVPSYPAPGYPAPEARSRPTVVTVATYLLYVVAAVQVINALIAFANSGKMSDALKDVYAGTGAEGAESIVSFVFIGGGVINLVLGAGFAVLGFLDGRGKNPARIVTWVVGGISLCCFGAGLGGTALNGAVDTGDTTTGGPTADEVQQRLDAALPSWYTGATTTLAVVALFAVLGTIILLALPASNQFFRKPVAGWDPSAAYPPYPGGGYPAQSPYPQAPYGGPSYPGQGQPGQPAPGLPPYPGQGTPPPTSSFPPASDPYAPPASDPYAPPASDPNRPPSTGGDQPPRHPTDPA